MRYLAGRQRVHGAHSAQTQPYGRPSGGTRKGASCTSQEPNAPANPGKRVSTATLRWRDPERHEHPQDTHLSAGV